MIGAIRLGNLSKGEPRNLVSYASPTSGTKRGDRKGVPTSVEKRKAGIWNDSTPNPMAVSFVVP